MTTSCSTTRVRGFLGGSLLLFFWQRRRKRRSRDRLSAGFGVRRRWIQQTEFCPWILSTAASYVYFVCISYCFLSHLGCAMCLAIAEPGGGFGSSVTSSGAGGQIKSCSGIEVLYASSMPDSFLSRLGFSFSGFDKATASGDVLPLSVADHPASVGSGSASSSNGLLEDLSSARCVVLSGRTMPLWTVPAKQTMQNGSFLSDSDARIESTEHPTYYDEQMQLLRHSRVHPSLSQQPPPTSSLFVVDPSRMPASVFKVLAPVSGFPALFAAFLFLPVVRADVRTGSGLFVSYKVATAEGGRFLHQHKDSEHGMLVDLDIQYRRCELDASEGFMPRDIPINVTLTISHCKPVTFAWLVRCSKSEHLQDVARGFHIGQVYTPSLPGDMVADGVARPDWSDVNGLTRIISEKEGVSDLFAWCKGCSEFFQGGLEMMFPSVVSDSDVVSCEIHRSRPLTEQQRTGKEADQTVGGAIANFFFHHSGGTEQEERLPANEDREKPFEFIRLSEGELLHYQVTYQCHKQGRSMIAVEFNFHASRTVQLVFRKECGEPGAFDVSCSKGILSADKLVCCPRDCGTCGGATCMNRNGGSTNCCEAMILVSSRECYSSGPPCKMGVSQHPSFVSAAGGLHSNSAAELLNILEKKGTSEDGMSGSQQTGRESTNLLSGKAGGGGGAEVKSRGEVGRLSHAVSPSITSFRRRLVELFKHSLFWLMIGLIVVALLIAYDKYSRGHRGKDLLPSTVEMMWAITSASRRCVTAVGGFLQKVRRVAGGLSSSKLGGAYEPIGPRAAVSLGGFVFDDEEEDDLTGTTSSSACGMTTIERKKNYCSSSSRGLPPGVEVSQNNGAPIDDTNFFSSPPRFFGANGASSSSASRHLPPLPVGARNWSRQEERRESPSSDSENNGLPFGSI